MASVTEAAPAKVNLFLHVVGRRADGFHLLDSLAIFPSVGDFLHAHDDTDLSLSVTGPFAAKLAGEADNLVLRAARTLAESVGTPARARLVLEKRLPVASGIGGGSADAAASLRALSRLWRVTVPEKLAARLGADVPVCLESRPMRMGGVGEILRDPPALPSGGMVLVNPGLSVATPSVFAARAGSGAAFSAPARVPPGWRDAEELAAWLSRVGNDLEAPAIGLCPAIADVLAALRAQPGCLLARMSGSGATCFGLFAAAAEAARTAIRLETPGWWVWGGAMAGAGPHVPGVAEPAREAVHDAARWGVAKRQGSGF